MSTGAIVTQEGGTQLETDLLTGGTLENWSLRLYQTNITPAITDTLATFTAAGVEATFTGYSAKTLTRSIAAGTWGAVASAGGTSINAGGNAKSTYGTQQSWSATSAQTIYGHFFSGVTSGKSILAQLWSSPVSLVNPSTLNITPVLELGAIGG